MRMDKFTIKAQEALAEAQNIAADSGQQQIEKEHLLLALLRQDDGITRPILQKIGVDPSSLENRLTDIIGQMPKVSGGSESFISNDF